jgi:hypothetical protein
MPIPWQANSSATAGVVDHPAHLPFAVWGLDILGSFPPPRAGAPMRRGPLAPGVPNAGTFGLFLQPKGRPRRFFPVAVDPMAAEKEEGSMALWKLSSPLRC